MTIKIKPVREIHHRLKALVYGNSGVGKTYLAGSAEGHEKMQGTLIANLEGGLLTLAGGTADTTDRITEVAQFRDLLFQLSPSGALHGKYQTLVVDSVTELQALCLAEILAAECKAKPKRDPDKLELQDYGKCTVVLRSLMRHVRNLDMHVVITALAKEELPEGSKHPISVRPDMTAVVGRSIMAMMDHVWYLAVKADDAGKAYRALLTQPMGPYQAKTRGELFARNLGDVVRDPHLPEIFEIFTEAQKQDTEEVKEETA